MGTCNVAACNVGACNVGACSLKTRVPRMTSTRARSDNTVLNENVFAFWAFNSLQNKWRVRCERRRPRCLGEVIHIFTVVL